MTSAPPRRQKQEEPRLHTRLWIESPAFHSLTLAAQGMWINLVAIMAVADPFGHLKQDDRYLNSHDLAALTGTEACAIGKLLVELQKSGLLQCDEDSGRWTSEKMVQAEMTRQRRAAGGKKGGNPNLLRRAEQ